MRGYSYLEMTAISWKTATFVLPCLIVCCLWNPQGPVTQHSFCFITRTKAWLTLFEIVCFRYNESNYSGLRWEQRGSRQHVSNIIGNDGILQQTGKKSNTNSGIFFYGSSVHHSAFTQVLYFHGSRLLVVLDGVPGGSQQKWCNLFLL